MINVIITSTLETLAVSAALLYSWDKIFTNLETFVKKICKFPTCSMSCMNLQKQSCQLYEKNFVF